MNMYMKYGHHRHRLPLSQKFQFKISVLLVNASLGNNVTTMSYAVKHPAFTRPFKHRVPLHI